MDSCSMSLDSQVGMPDDPGFSTSFWHMYKNDICTDTYFVLKTEDKEIVLNAHKMVLSIWSPVFEDMLYGPEKQDNRIYFSDVNPESFEDMMNFIYGCDPDLDSCKKAFELHKVAVRFEVTELISFCQKFFSEIKVEVTNVFEICEMAESMQNRSLIDKCMTIIQDKTTCILSFYECCDVTSSMIRIILKCPKLSLNSEYELLIWIFAWAKNMYLDKSMYSSVRDVLKKFLPQLHFLALTNVQFASICKLDKIFFEAEEAQSIFMNIAVHGSWPLPHWCDPDVKFRKYTGQQHNN